MSLSFAKLLIVGAVVLPAAAGLGLIFAALAMAAAWGWRGAMVRREDGRWPLARKLLTAGVGLLLATLAETAAMRVFLPA